MLDTNDIQVLKQIFGGMFGDFKVEIRDEMQSLLHIQKREIRDEMRALLSMTEKRIISEVTDFIGHQIIPQIDEHDREIRSIKHHLKLA